MCVSKEALLKTVHPLIQRLCDSLEIDVLGLLSRYVKHRRKKVGKRDMMGEKEREQERETSHVLVLIINTLHT